MSCCLITLGLEEGHFDAKDNITHFKVCKSPGQTQQGIKILVQQKVSLIIADTRFKVPRKSTPHFPSLLRGLHVFIWVNICRHQNCHSSNMKCIMKWCFDRKQIFLCYVKWSGRKRPNRNALWTEQKKKATDNIHSFNILLIFFSPQLQRCNLIHHVHKRYL